MVLAKNVEQLPSVHPEQPENRGLIHFYKSRAGWEYVTEEEFAMI